MNIKWHCRTLNLKWRKVTWKVSHITTWGWLDDAFCVLFLPIGENTKRTYNARMYLHLEYTFHIFNGRQKIKTPPTLTVQKVWKFPPTQWKKYKVYKLCRIWIDILLRAYLSWAGQRTWCNLTVGGRWILSDIDLKMGKCQDANMETFGGIYCTTVRRGEGTYLGCTRPKNM